MRNFLVGLLWLWFLGALGIYAYRLYRRFTRGSPADPEATETARTTPPAVPVIGSAPSRDIPPIAKTIPPLPPPASGSRVTGASEPADASPARSGLFAPTAVPDPASSPGAATSDTEARATVAEILHGITMPCDLSPLVDPDRVFDPYRVAFATNAAPAATVGAGIGDELERLEFTLASTADNQLAATKDGHRVIVTIHADPDAVSYGEGPAFRNAPPGSVVVEFQT